MKVFRILAGALLLCDLLTSAEGSWNSSVPGRCEEDTRCDCTFTPNGFWNATCQLNGSMESSTPFLLFESLWGQFLLSVNAYPMLFAFRPITSLYFWLGWEASTTILIEVITATENLCFLYSYRVYLAFLLLYFPFVKWSIHFEKLKRKLLKEFFIVKPK